MLHLKGILTLDQQHRLVDMCRDIAKLAPLVIPVMPSGSKFSVAMISCGQVGWTSDRSGYRYARTQPNGRAFPPIPENLADLAINIAARVGEKTYIPETCLINYYQPGTGKLGIHQDNSEVNLTPAIISISLGDDCEFLIGGTKRSDPMKTIILRSGDILVLHGDSRLAYHGVKRVIPGTSNLLKNGGRLNMTIRQVF